MTLYLIAHKVRGQPAFDVAERMECPHCRTYEYVEHMAVAESNMGCHACDGQGFWWIIPTSGHRAYPYWSISFSDMSMSPDQPITDYVPVMPSDWPDHYASPSLSLREPDAQRAEGRGLLAKLGLTRKTPFTDRRL
jgi:hypothetical protein